jgi:hypothetical protein
MALTDKTFQDGRQIAANNGTCRPGSFVQFCVGPPQKIEADGTPTWIARGANFVVAMSLLESHGQLEQHDIPDESMLLLSSAVPVTVSVGGVDKKITDEALAIVPPGSARITAHGKTLIVRVFSSAATAFCALASNAEAYSGDFADVAPLEYWPSPVGGFCLRVYPLRDHSEYVGFGRLFRSTNLMINVFEPSSTPRDVALLSPHDHADFEQGSLTLGGDFIHYLRTPWGADSAAWRADDQVECSDYSLMVIPPRMIHTTSWSTTGARLVDIFAGPRDDFSLKPQWVRNAADYPLPDRLLAC